MLDFLKKQKEVLLYVLFGVLTTVVSWVTYALFVNLGLGVTVSNILSWVLAVVFAFVTNKLWVFTSPSWRFSVLLREAGTFLSARLATGVLEILCVPLLIATGFDVWMLNLAHGMGLQFAVLETEGIFSKMLVTVVVIILNYFFSKFLVFVKKEK